MDRQVTFILDMPLGRRKQNRNESLDYHAHGGSDSTSNFRFYFSVMSYLVSSRMSIYAFLCAGGAIETDGFTAGPRPYKDSLTSVSKIDI